MTRLRVSRGAARVAMRTSIAGSALLLVALLARGWGRDAWTTAAAVLFLLCVVTCIVAGVIGGRSEREVRRAVDRLAMTRSDAGRHPRRDGDTEGTAR